MCGYFSFTAVFGDVQIFRISSVSFPSAQRGWPSTAGVWLIQQGEQAYWDKVWMFILLLSIIYVYFIT